jgi:hypothetical protein
MEPTAFRCSEREQRAGPVDISRPEVEGREFNLLDRHHVSIEAIESSLWPSARNLRNLIHTRAMLGTNAFVSNYLTNEGG